MIDSTLEVNHWVEGHFFTCPFFPRDHFFPNFDKNMIIYKWGGFFQKVKSAFCRASETASERKKIPPKTKSKFELYGFEHISHRCMPL